MWYGILLALSGGLSGLVVAFWYRYKYAMQSATIVGLQKDNASLDREMEILKKLCEDSVTNTATLVAAHKVELQRKDKLVEDAHAELDRYKAAIKVLRTKDPAAAAAALGELFPVTNKNNSQDGSGH